MLKKNQKRLQWGTALGWALGTLFLCWTSITSFQQHELQNQKQSQYQRLADSLLNGKLSLDLPVPQGLNALTNPYNSEENKFYISPHIDKPLWDTSYYKGKIYLYYGIVPAATLFVPYKFITGQDLDMRLALLILCIIASSAAIGCLRQLIKSSQLTQFVSSLVLIIAPNYAYILRRPEMYEIAVAGGAAMTMLSLYFLIKAHKISGWKNITIGGICWVLSIGSRPTAIFNAGIVLLSLCHKIYKYDKKAVVYTSLAILIVGSLLALYNYARFESPFSFGSEYVLTGLTTGPNGPPLYNTQIITHNLPLYLLNPPHWNWQFPYAHPNALWHGLGGQQLCEPLTGIITLSPITILAFVGIFLIFSKNYDSRSRYNYALLSLSWLPILISTTALTLTSMRYIIDFSPAMVLSGTLVACQWIKTNNKWKKIIATLLLLASLPTPMLISIKGIYNTLERLDKQKFETLSNYSHKATDPLKNLIIKNKILVESDHGKIKVPSINFLEAEFNLNHAQIGTQKNMKGSGTYKFETYLDSEGSLIEFRLVSIGKVELLVNDEKLIQSEGGPAWNKKYLPKGKHKINILYQPIGMPRFKLLGYYKREREDHKTNSSKFYYIGQDDGYNHWSLP